MYIKLLSQAILNDLSGPGVEVRQKYPTLEAKTPNGPEYQQQVAVIMGYLAVQCPILTYIVRLLPTNSTSIW
jgi:hypothetical protein